MNKDEATQKWIADHTMGDLKPHDGAIKCFREGVEAGQRAERERIADKLIKKSVEIRDDPEVQTLTPRFNAGHTAACTEIIDVIIELKADPAESGE